MSKPTQWQYSVAALFKIPYEQAHTISSEKAKAYFNHCKTKECRLEFFLNGEHNKRELREQKTWMKGDD